MYRKKHEFYDFLAPIGEIGNERREILGEVIYFLVGAIPWREISCSARSAIPSCSRIASRRIRS
jgi:hypothetical protein